MTNKVAPVPAVKTVEQITDELVATVGAPHRQGLTAIAILLAVILWGAFAFIWQAVHGLRVTAMTNYFSWGVYIVNFVFFIGVSHAGTLVSAILRVTGAQWRRPITRMAEAITLFALMVGAPMVIIDMGRPDRMLNIVSHGRLQSPIVWDVLSICTYMTGSIIYLYLPMIPDLAILRDRGVGRLWQKKLYRALALNWRGTPKQHQLLERAIAIMAIVIIPVAISVHTVVSYIFSMTLRPGWHSTIFGPYFVVGAIFSGIAAIITAMALFRHFSHLSRYLTEDVFKKLGALLLTLNLVYIYFTFSEYITMGYTGETRDNRLLTALLHGPYAARFWGMVIIGLLIPAVLLALPWTRNLRGIVTASILVNIGMWMKRFIIVIPTLAAPFMPVQTPGGAALSYVPTWVEWSITAAAFATFTLLYFLFATVFPIISIWEVTENADASEAAPALAANSAPLRLKQEAAL